MCSASSSRARSAVSGSAASSASPCAELPAYAQPAFVRVWRAPDLTGTFKLRNGTRVTVNNDVGPEAQLDPRPENR